MSAPAMSVLHEAMLAVVAVDEAMHRLVRTVDLHLDKPSFFAAARLTREKSFEALTESATLFSVPVRALLVKALQDEALAFTPRSVRRQFIRVEF